MKTYEVPEQFVDSAVNLVAYCRNNGYPTIGSEGFLHLTQLVNSLDIEVRKFLTHNLKNESDSGTKI